jgi:phage major head subunit gpT-like protein
MDTNRGNMDALFTGYSQAFKNGLALGGVEFESLCTVVGSGTKITEFPFLQQLGGMREWLGPRQIKNISSKKLQVTARTFEDSVGMPVNDLDDDQLGLYTPLVTEMGMNAGNLWGELAFAALLGNATWLDGVAFFSAAGRAYDGKNAINNYGTSALTSATYATAYKAMMGYLGHGGKPLNIVPDTLLVGPKLLDTAKKIVEIPAELTSGATGESAYVNWTSAPNPWYNSARLIVSTQLVGTYDDYWFLMCTKRPLRPVVLVKRQEPKLTRLDRETDANVALEDKILYLTKGRGEAALTMPHLVIGNYVS